MARGVAVAVAQDRDTLDGVRGPGRGRDVVRRLAGRRFHAGPTSHGLEPLAAAISDCGTPAWMRAWPLYTAQTELSLTSLTVSVGVAAPSQVNDSAGMACSGRAG